MTKRIIALLLALILTVGLLPTVALATEGGEETTANAITNPESQTANGVTLSKTAAKNNDGTYTIRLEAYARGSSTTTETTEEVPTDIILVLDRSGSMSEKMGAVKYSRYEGRQTRNDNLYDNKDNLYYQLKDGSYVKVTVERKQEDIYTAYPGNTTNGTYYDDSNDYWDPVTLYAQTSDGYVSVEVERKGKWVSGEGILGSEYRHFYTYTLKNGTKIASDIKGSKTVPEFTGVTSQVLYTKSTQNVYTYTYVDAAGQEQLITTSTGDSTELRKNPMWYQWVDSDGGDSKMEALKDAASNFVDSVEKKAAGTNGKTVDHRIAVVSFASTTTNDTNGFKDMTKPKDVNAVKTAISQLGAGGGTLVDGGIREANKIFKANSIEEGTNRNRVVIVFTDGAPGLYGNWKSESVSTANNAIIAAKASKDTYKATVFTIGIFAGAQNSLPIPDYTQYTFWGPYEVSPSDADQTKNSNRFMHLVSTNYPSATDIENPGEQNKNTGYYLTASDSASLNNVFQQISNQIQNVTTTDLDANAVVTDTVGDSFSFDGKAESYAVKVAAFEKLENEQYTFSSTETTDSNVKANITGKTISVTGFNFQDEWCGYETKDSTQTPHGRKLIIELKVTADAAGCEDPNIPTNDGNAKIVDKDGKTAVEITSPTVPGYRVTYDEGTNDTTVANMPASSNYFINGTTVASGEPTRAGYTFAGWKMTGDTTEKTYKANDPISFNGSDVELVAQWTAKTLAVDLGAFVKKNFTMTEGKKLPGSGEKFKVTVTQTEPAVEGETAPSYEGTVTVEENGTYAFAFTENENPTLTYGVDYEFSVSETKGTNTSIHYDDESYTLRLKLKEVSENGETKIVAEGNSVTVQNSYIETYTLTYHSNSGTGEVPTDSINYTSGQTATLKFDKIPTHADSAEGNKIVFLGWSAEQDTEIHESEPSNLIYEIQMTDNKTVYAVWGYDKNKNGNPDFYDATATYNIVNGKWSDSSTTKTEIVKVKEKNANGQWVPTNNKLQHIPSTADVIPNTGYTQSGNWDTTPSSESVFTQDTTYTYTLQRTEKVNVTYTWSGLDSSDFDTNYPEPTKPGDATPDKGSDYTVDPTHNNSSIVIGKNGVRYKFSGWSSATEGVVIGENGKINGIQTNVTLTGTWTKLGSGTFDLNGKIFKVFDKADGSRDIPSGSYTFKATVTRLDKENNNQKTSEEYTGTVTLDGATGAATSSFVFSSQITFHTDGEYRFLVEETPNTVTTLSSDEQIRYDGAVYYLYVTVSDDLKTINYRFDPVVAIASAEEEFAAAENQPITFHNYYCAAKEPGKYTIDFSNFIRKELTKTGDRSFNGAEFTANVDGWRVHELEITMMRASAGFGFEPLNSVSLKAAFPADITFEADGKAYRGFTGDTLTVTAGRYLFLIDEINDGQTNITYDESKYWLALRLEEDLTTGEVSLVGKRVKKFVEGDTKETVIEATDWTEVPASIYPVYFENTIDTGKDDYYPIIIPTIINKDTGMLNKTDHFAYVIGYPDGTVHPNGQITRAEVATIFFRLLRDEVRDGAFTTSNTYSDVAYGKWYNNPISTMSALGIITGYPDGTFKPNKPITRAEFAAIAARFDETQSGKSATFSDVIGHWAAKEIGIAYYNDWIKGYPDGTFKPDQNITRAEAMTLINRVLERKPESPADLLTNMNKWTDNMDTSKWYYLDVQEATNSHGYTRKTFNYELWRQMLPDPDWSRYER